MPTESNTGSDIGPNTTKRSALIKTRGQNETRYLAPAETPREKMLRVVKAVRKKNKGA